MGVLHSLESCGRLGFFGVLYNCSRSYMDALSFSSSHRYFQLVSVCVCVFFFGLFPEFLNAVWMMKTMEH